MVLTNSLRLAGLAVVLLTAAVARPTGHAEQSQPRDTRPFEPLSVEQVTACQKDFWNVGDRIDGQDACTYETYDGIQACPLNAFGHYNAQGPSPGWVFYKCPTSCTDKRAANGAFTWEVDCI